MPPQMQCTTNSIASSKVGLPARFLGDSMVQGVPPLKASTVLSSSIASAAFSENDKAE